MLSMKIDTTKFNHDANVPGFEPLISLFSEVLAGRTKYDNFMVEWNKASDEARAEFKKFMKIFYEVTAPLFAGGESDE